MKCKIKEKFESRSKELMIKAEKKYKFWVFIRNFLLVLIGALVIWVIYNNLLSAYEQKKYKPLGEIVEVDGKEMHIYSKGEGDNTIVLMSGLGTAAPVLDFEPLIDEISKTNRVVVVEPFGYGWSDITNKERTVKNIVEEMRLALKKADIPGPYILMPHSISGIYSMYFATTYPEEVKAIVGIDPTLPQALNYFGENSPTMPSYLSYLAPTGIARLALMISPENFLPIASDGTYSEENLKMTKAISAWKGYNKSVVNETNNIEDTVDMTVGMKFPPNIPVLIFTTEKGDIREDGKNNLSFYKTQLTNTPSSKVVLLVGHHYLHWTRYEEISKDVNEFINSFNENQ
ncbi:alpha/beta fold hydrolase [Anaerobacillus sp. 1_MG-2023]|uniref:alpha/beta fold hydrolase n=1 Tax=Anaerobacillus sp. 1_MG-2023 TaxID=3062655 RepID=UPI0026E32B7A|nr:alpha/beta hydrolase [Anaerobacillus sp. 1_MG-2023]MDO6658754.1 alpha/beta hydrolase [Anaerobacillus sp. 1_MG-2023]